MSSAEQLEKMRAGLARAQREREERARAVLGPSATPEQIAQWAKEALMQQRSAKRLENEARKRQKAAGVMMAQVAAGTQAPPATAPQGAPFTPPPPTAQPSQAAAEALYNHPIFGASVRPDAVVTVDIDRLVNGRPQWLEEWPFESFSKSAVRSAYGGGRYRAHAKDGGGRIIASNDFEIDGVPKPFQPVYDQPLPASLDRRGAAFQTEPPKTEDEPPRWLREHIMETERRMERLEALVTTPRSADTEADKLKLLREELELKEAAKDREHARKIAEIRETMKAERERDEERQRKQAETAAQAAEKASAPLQAFLVQQGEMNKTLLTSLLAPKPAEAGGGQLALITPLLTAMSTMAEISQKQQGAMFQMMRDLATGDEKPRTIGSRIMDLVEDAGRGIAAKGGDTLIVETIKKVMSPQQQQQPKQEARREEPSAFQLPDGRIIPPAVCADFIMRYKARHGVNPSMEVCAQAFMAWANSQPQQPQIAHQPQAPQQPVQQPQTPLPTPAQAEEMVMQAGLQAAQAATQAGATPEQAAQAAAAARQKVIDGLQARIQASRAPQPVAAPVQQQVVQPVVPQAPALPLVPQAPPAPAPAAVEAMKALEAQRAASATPAAAGAPVVPNAPPVSMTMTVEAPPADVISIPYMSKSFLIDVTDAFQAGHAPLDFLERSMKQGKISEEARRAIGEIYDNSEEDESVSSLMLKVKTLLEPKGVDMPLTFLTAFQADPDRGASWLEDLLIGCSYDTIEEARKEAAA